MLVALGAFLDHAAGSVPEQATIRDLASDLRSWTGRLAESVVPESDQAFARRPDLPNRGSTLSPEFVATEVDDNSVTGTARFGRYFMGGNGAAHGGSVALLFDEVLGRLANRSRPMSRTAYLHIDYRAIAPVDRELTLRAWFEVEEGRKRRLRATLCDGGTVCAEAHGLFVALRPGQP
ncbi:MAG: thioesterase [Gordonia sp.]|nr:thioesterase [Gordonia sp. (in: high G+C Gram-positive bacteria)]